MRFKKGRGEVTVFLTLLFSIVSALVLTAVESARAQAIRLMTEQVMQTSIHSCFGEYNQDLWEKYRLLAIDASYRGGRGSIDDVREHLLAYAERNFHIDAGADWEKCDVEDCAILSWRFLSDQNGNVLIDQVIEEMTQRGALSYRPDILHAKERMQEDDDSIFMYEFASAIERSGDIPGNPARKVFEIAIGTDPLDLVADGTRTGASFGAERSSGRTLNRGNYSRGLRYAPDQTFLFDTYLESFFGNHTRPLEHAVFSCEQEYLVMGYAKEDDCLSSCAGKILAQREYRNLEGMESNEEVLRRTEELAKKLCKQGGDLYYTQRSLIYAWAFAEAAVETGSLLHGAGAPMDHYTEPLIVPLQDLKNFTDYCGAVSCEGESYQDFLNGLLANVSQSQKAVRALDLIEQNMRKLGHPGFYADACVTYFEARMKVGSAYGHGCIIEREYGYATY